MSIRSSLLILIAIGLSLPARADELWDGFLSIRAAGMGNAYTAIVDNDDAIFYNPASLCKISGFHLLLMDPQVRASGVELAQEISNLQSASGSQFASTLQKFYGKEASVGVDLKAAISVPCLAAAGFGGFEFSAKLDNPAFPNLYVRSITDYGMGAGFAMDLVPNFVTFGLVGRGIKRLGSNVPIGPTILTTLSSTALTNQLANSGTGYGVDGAVNITLPTPVRPTLTAVYKNMGDTTFTSESGTAAPPTDRSQLTVGGGVSIDTLLLSIRPAFDFKHVTDQNIQLGKKVHAGIEVALPLIALRTGLYQGYYTAGLGINFGLLHIDAATWGVELGEYPGQDESRRYGIQIRTEFSFDADFSFASIGRWGGGKKLKHRR